MTTAIRPTTDGSELDVLVIGAGQAGLVAGYYLAQQRLRLLIVDAGEAIGHVWRSRWDSLRLFTPARCDALPGMRFPASPQTHPTKDQVADYLRAYAGHHRLPVRLGTRVTGLHRTPGTGGFTIATSTATLRARQVIVATGPFQRPYTPPAAEIVSTDVLQLHSGDYRNPDQLPTDAWVLVVGAANSGLQIAAELAATHQVTVAVGTHPPRLPQRIAGRDLFFWLSATGLMSLPATSRLARRIRARGEVVVGSSPRALRRHGVTFRPRLTTFTGRTAHFADDATAGVDAVIWATGYRPDYRWLHIPDVVDGGQVRHLGGVTAIPGLYFLGLPWQTTRGSALLGFVGRDADRLVTRIAAHAANP